MRRGEVLGKLPVSDSDFVVEIGAGDRPFYKTKLIIDKFPFENTERWADIKRMAPVIKGDAIKLPLADKSVDLLFASHVLEHVDEPTRFLAEAKRCARFIYLEFPSLKRELMYAWSYHRWLIEISGTRLIFYKNDMPQMFGDFFHRGHDLLLELWSEHRFEELNNHIFAETDQLTAEFSEKTVCQYAVSRCAPHTENVNFAAIEKRPYTTPQLAKLLLFGLAPARAIELKKKVLNRWGERKDAKLGPAILQKMICQRCRERRLEFGDGAIGCPACGARYEQTRGVFDFDV